MKCLKVPNQHKILSWQPLSALPPSPPPSTESVYIDGNRQFFSDYLDLGANQSNDTGGIEHAYNLIAVASRLGMKPRLGDLSALMAAIEEAEPPYERAAFYLLRKMEEFVRVRKVTC